MSATIKLFHGHFDENHLAKVAAEMATLGAPVIRAVWDAGNGVWLAVEGCHRLRAAHALGLAPELVAVSWAEAADVVDAETGNRLDPDELQSQCERSARNDAWLEF